MKRAKQGGSCDGTVSINRITESDAVRSITVCYCYCIAIVVVVGGDGGGVAIQGKMIQAADR